MSLPVILLPRASEDLAQSQAWYELQKIGLGGKYLRAIRQALQMIEFKPTAFPFAENRLRRALVERFPYAIYFRVEKDAVYVVGIIHSSRDSDIWRNRS